MKYVFFGSVWVVKAEEMNMFSLIIIQFSFVTVRHSN